MTAAPRELSIAFQTDKRPREYSRLAAIVEDYGFDVLSMYGDLTYQPPIVPLTLAALATSQIRLGPASLNPFTLHPIEIAGQIATLDMASAGRAYLGVSRGAWLDAIGVEQRRPISRVVDTLGAVQHLLAHAPGPYIGATLRIEAAIRLRYEPERPAIPLLLGTWGERLIRRAAALVDEIKLGGSTNPAIVPLVQAWIEASRASATGRSPGIVMGAVTIVDEDRRTARALIKREMALYLPVVASLDPTVAVDPELLARIDELVDAGEVTAAGNLIPDDLLRRFSFAGTPEDIIEQCEELFEAGARRIEFGTPHGRTSELGLELLGDRVLPALQRWRV